jgi:tetratricopeptide (TPR) repeat protein
MEAVDLAEGYGDRSGADTFAHASYSLGMMMRHLGWLEEAEAALLKSVAALHEARAFELSPSPLVELAHVYLELGRPEEALSFARRAERALTKDQIGKNKHARVLNALVRWRRRWACKRRRSSSCGSTMRR